MGRNSKKLYIHTIIQIELGRTDTYTNTFVNELIELPNQEAPNRNLQIQVSRYADESYN